MTSLTDTNGSVLSYAFDGEGNRVRQSLNDCLATRFVYDGGNVVAEMNASNEVVWAWVNGAGMDQPVERIAFINGTARNRQVYHTDGLGSVAALSGESGEPVQTYAYAAFGGIRAQTGTDLNRVTFTAREALGDSLGFFYYRHRVYDPNTGRFTSEDPLGFLAGPNLYIYCANNPVSFIDPLGEDLVYGNTDNKRAKGWHQKVAAGDYGQSFGKEGGGIGSVSGSQSQPGPNSNNTGDGTVYEDADSKFTKIKGRIRTTIEEDKWLAKQMRKELDNKGDYNVCFNSCRHYSKDLFTRMKELLFERRAKCGE